MRKRHVHVEKQLAAAAEPGEPASLWRLAGSGDRLRDQRDRLSHQRCLPVDAEPRAQHREGGHYMREDELPVRFRFTPE